LSISNFKKSFQTISLLAGMVSACEDEVFPYHAPYGQVATRRGTIKGRFCKEIGSNVSDSYFNKLLESLEKASAYVSTAKTPEMSKACQILGILRSTISQQEEAELRRDLREIASRVETASEAKLVKKATDHESATASSAELKKKRKVYDYYLCNNLYI
jgi:hypothetical protein